MCGSISLSFYILHFPILRSFQFQNEFIKSQHTPQKGFENKIVTDARLLGKLQEREKIIEEIIETKENNVILAHNRSYLNP